MTVRIHYETPNGIETVERDERVHKDHVVAAYDNPRDVEGVKHKVEIPTDRVIRISHDGQEWSE